jgi:hypothetical protein
MADYWSNESTYKPTDFQGQPYKPPTSWNPNVPAAQTGGNMGAPAQTSNPWNAPTGINTDPSKWTTTNANQWAQYMSTMLPYQQYVQNTYQYGNDFNEAQRRWNQQQNWTQQTDQYNMGLTGRQQQMAEWQAQEAARQWQNQFDYQRGNDAFSQDLANRQFGLSQQTQDQSYQIAAQQNAINQAYNQGRLTNDQRQLALAELTQQQQNAYQYANLAATQGWNREELAATQQYRAQQDQLARAQMAQQAQLQAQQLEAARQNAILQATGRNQAPNAKWMRRT